MLVSLARLAFRICCFLLLNRRTVTTPRRSSPTTPPTIPPISAAVFGEELDEKEALNEGLLDPVAWKLFVLKRQSVVPR